MPYRNLLTKFALTLEAEVKLERTNASFPVTMGVNAFRGFLDEFIKHHKKEKKKQDKKVDNKNQKQEKTKKDVYVSSRRKLGWKLWLHVHRKDNPLSDFIFWDQSINSRTDLNIFPAGQRFYYIYCKELILYEHVYVHVNDSL